MTPITHYSGYRTFTTPYDGAGSDPISDRDVAIRSFEHNSRMQIERNEIRCFHAVVEAGGFSRRLSGWICRSPPARRLPTSSTGSARSCCAGAIRHS